MLGVSSSSTSSESGMSPAFRFRELLNHNAAGSYGGGELVEVDLSSQYAGIESSGNYLGDFAQSLDAGEPPWSSADGTVARDGNTLKHTNDGGSGKFASIVIICNYLDSFTITATFDPDEDCNSNGKLVAGNDDAGWPDSGVLTKGTSQTVSVNFQQTGDRQDGFYIFLQTTGADTKFTKWTNLSLKHRTDG